MVQVQSKVHIIDNTGGLVGQCIKVLKPKEGKIAKLGDLILLSIKKHRVGSKIKKGELHKALIVRTKITKRAKINIEYSDNAVLLVKDLGELTPIGNRFKGPISSVLRKKKGSQKLMLLAKFII